MADSRLQPLLGRRGVIVAAALLILATLCAAIIWADVEHHTATRLAAIGQAQIEVLCRLEKAAEAQPRKTHSLHEQLRAAQRTTSASICRAAADRDRARAATRAGRRKAHTTTTTTSVPAHHSRPSSAHQTPAQQRRRASTRTVAPVAGPQPKHIVHAGPGATRPPSTPASGGQIPRAPAVAGASGPTAPVPVPAVEAPSIKLEAPAVSVEVNGTSPTIKAGGTRVTLP